MFTGIVQSKARVSKIMDDNHFRRLRISVADNGLNAVERGASIAINGVCLTVTDFIEATGVVFFDVIEETLEKTNLGKLQEGDEVNFERSLRFGSEIGGHIVSGHIQTTALISAIDKTEHNCTMRLTLAPDVMCFILEKGFVAVEGCSLTVGKTFIDGFNIHLIPETLNITTLGSKQVGDMLNIELCQQTQTIVQTVERIMALRASV